MKLEVLNNKEHAKLKVNSVYQVNSGYDYNFCPVYPIEYTSLQSDYPIFFTKNNANNNGNSLDKYEPKINSSPKKDETRAFLNPNKLKPLKY